MDGDCKDGNYGEFVYFWNIFVSNISLSLVGKKFDNLRNKCKVLVGICSILVLNNNFMNKYVSCFWKIYRWMNNFFIRKYCFKDIW